MTIPNERVGPVESMPLKAEEQGLLIAIRPITDKTEIEESFHTALIDKGILPILVMAKNINSSLSFVLSKDNIAVVDQESLLRIRKTQAKGEKVTSEALASGIATTGFATAMGTGPIVSSALGTAMMGVTGAATVLGATAGGGILGLGLLFGSMKMLSDAQIIEHNLGMKQFYSHTLGPGETISGYIYFQPPKGATAGQQYLVFVEAIESAKEEKYLFQFPLNYRAQ